MHKWLEVAERNPNRNVLVPTQIASVAELKERTLTVLKAVKEAKERLKLARESQNLVMKTCEADIEQGIKLAHERNMLIKARFSQVFGKFERVLTEHGRVSLSKKPQQDLICRQQALQSQLTAPRNGLLDQVDQARQISHKALLASSEFRSAQNDDGKVGGREIEKQQVDDADLRDILRVMRSQREGIEIL